MTEEERLNWMYWDAMAEGTDNPLFKLYYLIRMKGVELWSKLKTREKIKRF
jgi:hypothetical protein